MLQLYEKSKRIFSNNFVDLYRTLPSLCNGGLVVKVSDLIVQCSQENTNVLFTLGLFAGKIFQEGDIVTLYGGMVRPQRECNALDACEKTHIRSIPNSSFCWDGKPYSMQFDVSQATMAKEYSKKPEDRTSFYPSTSKSAHPLFTSYKPIALPTVEDPQLLQAFLHGNKIPQSLCRAGLCSTENKENLSSGNNDCCLGTSKFEHQPHLESAIAEQICHGPIGYMANTSSKINQNVKIQWYERKLLPPLNDIGFVEVAFVASRVIQAGEEILCPYNNWESKWLVQQ